MSATVAGAGLGGEVGASLLQVIAVVIGGPLLEPAWVCWRLCVTNAGGEVM